MVRPSSFVAASFIVFVLSLPALAQEVVLSVNHNPVSVGDAEKVLMGALDPNIITVEGPANARYVILESKANSGPIVGSATLPKPSTSSRGTSLRRRYVSVLAIGALDEDGSASVVLPPETVENGEEFSLKALVVDTATPSVAVSGEARVEVLPTMSSGVTLNMPAGSVARIFGPLMDHGDDFVSVGNLRFEITNETEFGNFESVDDLDDIGDDEWVDVAGEFNAAGGFDAKELNIEDSSSLVRIRGRVQGVGEAGFALLGVSVFVSSESSLVDEPTGDDAEFSDVEEGMVVEVRVPAEVAFPHVDEGTINMSTELEPEEEPEPEIEIENETSPAFCS